MTTVSDAAVDRARHLHRSWPLFVTVVAAVACWTGPATAMPPCVATARQPERIPPDDGDWKADPERATRLLDQAREAFDAGRWRPALRLIERAMEADDETDPAARPYYGLRADCLRELGEPGADTAVDRYNAAAHAARRGDFAEARRLYDEALLADPGMLWAANNRAWLGATHPDPAARDDADAIAYALYACIESDWREWSFVDTLGAALAEAGRFADAGRCAERALRLAPEQHRAEVEATIVAYRRQQPRREEVAEAPDVAAPAGGAEGEPVAAAGVVLGMTPPELVRIMRRAGYAVDLVDGRFASWMIEGYKTQVFVAEDGQSLQFHSSFSDTGADLAKVNAWNGTKRYSRSYLDEDGDPHVELDLDLAGGVTEARVVDFLRTCQVSFARWVAEVVSPE